MAEPLAAHAKFRTRRADEAQAEAARVLSALELRIRRDAPLDARLNAAAYGPVVLCWMDYGAAVEVRAPELGDYVAVNMPTAGSMRVAHRGTEFVADRRTAAVFSPTGDLRMRYADDLRQLIVRVDERALVEHLAALAPDARTDALRFASAMDTTVRRQRSGAPSRCCRTCSSVIRRACRPWRAPASWRCSSRRCCSDSPGRTPDALHAEPAPATARTVRRAREFIDAEPERVATVREIAAAAGVGVRSLQAAFRAQLGESPSAYAQRARLAGAHAALRDADPGDGTTVTEVALRFGFAHTGRFAAAYRRRYGQAPSATLRG